MKEYSFLEPIQIANRTLRNRIIMSAMVKRMCTDDGFITDDYVAYYEARAKGGVSLIIPGAMIVDPDWPYIFPCQPWLSDDKYIPGLKKAIDAVHAGGALFVCQLWHNGLRIDETGKPASKSVNDLTIDEIHSLQEKFFTAACRAKEAGADGVEFHCAHTYLPSQFLSPYFNKRTDEYGADTVENAMRFSIEVIDRIHKELCDGTFFIISKINGSDFIEGGTTPERAVEAGVLMEKAGVSMITVNGGGPLTSLIGMSDDGRQPEGWKISFATKMKEAVNIPVAGCGSLRHPEYVDSIIREGKCDIAAMGRTLVAEPEWVNKATSGREDEMRYCISCMFCFNEVGMGRSGCSVNPFVKRELYKPKLVCDGARRTVVIAGAGVAGLEAAVTLTKRGFKPIVLEKSNHIGGQVRLATMPPGKTKINWMLDYYKHQINRLNIDVRLKTAATKESVLELKPYAVIVATGSAEIIPHIEGINGKTVLDARTLLADGCELLGKKVVVLGGGLTGLETARLLRSKGNSVTVIEMLPNTVRSVEAAIAIADCKIEGIQVMFSHKVLSVSGKSVKTLSLEDNNEVTFDADIVVRSFGVKSMNKLYDELSKELTRVYKVGDCIEPGKIHSAVETGSLTAYAIK